jgi:flavorubredoxin
LVLKLLDTVAQLGLEIDMICPDHGIIWRKDPGKIISAYAKWAKQEQEKKAVVVYDTMWHSTEAMANEIAAGMANEGISVRPIHIRSSHRSEIMTEVLDAAAVVVGSPTLNNQLFPTVSDFLIYMKGLKPLNKIGAAFGSYGWSGEAVKLINEELEAMKFYVIDPGIKIQYVPEKEGLEDCFELGQKIGKAINEKQ